MNHIVPDEPTADTVRLLRKCYVQRYIKSRRGWGVYPALIWVDLERQHYRYFGSADNLRVRFNSKWISALGVIQPGPVDWMRDVESYKS